MSFSRRRRSGLSFDRLKRKGTYLREKHIPRPQGGRLLSIPSPGDSFSFRVFELFFRHGRKTREEEDSPSASTVRQKKAILSGRKRSIPLLFQRRATTSTSVLGGKGSLWKGRGKMVINLTLTERNKMLIIPACGQ